MLGYHGQCQYKLIFHQNRNAHVAAGYHALYVIVGGQYFGFARCQFQARFKPERQVDVTETTLALHAYTAIHGQPELGFIPLVDFAGQDKIEVRARTAGLRETRQGFNAQPPL